MEVYGEGEVCDVIRVVCIATHNATRIMLGSYGNGTMEAPIFSTFTFRCASSTQQRKLREIQNEFDNQLALRIHACADLGEYIGLYDASKAVYGPTHQLHTPLHSSDGQVLLTDNSPEWRNVVYQRLPCTENYPPATKGGAPKTRYKDCLRTYLTAC